MAKRRKVFPFTKAAGDSPPEPWRRRTKTVRIGAVKIGGGNPVSIQSMSKTATANVQATVRQIRALEKAGGEIVRLAVKDERDASVLDKIKAKIRLPLVADIHFNYRLALEAIRRGVDGLRLNPGNIFRPEEVKQIARAARKRKIPIRVGVNAGSLPKKPETQDQKPEDLSDLLVKVASEYIKLLEGFDFYDIIVSLKAADVPTTVWAYRKMAKLSRYPLHLGITATGLPESGVIKSAMGIGSLLLEGIGDTLRVSLTAEPEKEVQVAKEILQCLGLRNFGPQIIACPTCGRTQVDLVRIAQRLKRRLSDSQFTIHDSPPLKIAIMGCEVNGPGEAGATDLGVACGRSGAVLFKQGKIVRQIKQSQIISSLISELKK